MHGGTRTGRHVDEDIGHLTLRAGGTLRVHEHAPDDGLRQPQLDVGLLPEGLGGDVAAPVDGPVQVLRGPGLVAFGDEDAPAL